MSAVEILDYVVRIGFVAGVPGAVIWFIRDRRKNRAESDIAEQTVGANVALQNLGVDAAQLQYINQAMQFERDSWMSQVKNRDGEIERQRKEIEYRDGIIERLRGQVEKMETQLHDLSAQLNVVRHELNNIAMSGEPSSIPPPREAR